MMTTGKTLALILQLLLSFGGGDAGQAVAPEPAPLTFDASFESVDDFSYAQRAVFTLSDIDQLDSITFRVATKPGNIAEDIQVRYARTALERLGAIDPVAGTVRVTVFGLYADYLNSVALEVADTDGQVTTQQYELQTLPATMGSDLPDWEVSVAASEAPVSYMLLRSSPSSPVILDIDGETRWRAPAVSVTTRTAMAVADGFISGAPRDPDMFSIAWDGSVTPITLGSDEFTTSHHSLEYGKRGILNTVGYEADGVIRPESVLIEMSEQGEVLKKWDFDEIMGDFIREKGEDPARLIQDDFDWFHMNSAIYDPGDDSIIASSRENFVVKVDYESGDLIWILGNPEKLWFTAFPNSLQTLALQTDGNWPIGQHALSVEPDGQLMLFDNGWGNVMLTNVGDSRTYSKVSIYDIDEEAFTARETWSFDYDQSINSDICSSVYRTRSGNLLILYSAANSRRVARFVVVNDDREVLFDASMGQRESDPVACFMAANAKELALQDWLIE